MDDPGDRVPRGLVLFAPGTPPGYRRRRIAFLAVYLAAAVSLVWPVYALMAGPEPLILGMPLPMAWVAMWMAIVFATLLWLYRGEYRNAGPNGDDDAGSESDPEAPASGQP